MGGKFDAVIIGGGLGGLSAGAFLAKAGKKVILLEMMDALGGRCRSVEMMGHRFDIGADYFGAGMLDLYKELGKADEVRPASFRMLADHGGKTMTLPPGLHTLADLSRMGMSPVEILISCIKMVGVLKLGRDRKFGNNQQLIRHVTDNEHLRNILNIGAYFTGNDPENMPSYWFRLLFGDTYGYAKPFYPKGGAGRLPELLADVVRENGGGIVYEAGVEKILIEDKRAVGVKYQGGEVRANNVISNMGILQTVLLLAGKEHFPYGFLDTLSYYRPGLAMASVFVVFRRSAGIKKGVLTYASYSDNMREMFRILGEGQFPPRQMFVLSCPGAVDDPGDEHLSGTLKFLVPKGRTDKNEIDMVADMVLRDVDRLVPGFYESIVDRTLLTPADYKDRFGFTSIVSPVAESVHYEKFPASLPVRGLYCVGSTVLPVGGCTTSSMESGRDCANEIIKGSAIS